MKTDVGAVKTVTDVLNSSARAAIPAEPAVTPRPKAPPTFADVRLVIEEDRESGTFIYKTLDRVTGEVLLQLPRENVLKALNTGSYAAGSVVKTRA